jgi:hypothetical protein
VHSDAELHTRSEVAVGVPDSNWSTSHSVSCLHSRSVPVVGSTVWYCVSAHSVSMVQDAERSGAKYPPEHGLQDAEPVLDAKVPAAHCVHVSAFTVVLTVPGGQSTHDETNTVFPENSSTMSPCTRN